MIGWLQGRIIDKPTEGRIVVDVQGVGYDVEVSLQTFFHLPKSEQIICLHIHTIVREDALLLYGFLDKTERTLFRALIKVNGIGPKVAMTILSHITPDEFYRCIQTRHTEHLIRLPGIGKKTVERLFLEMQTTYLDMITISSTSQTPQQEAMAALLSLGYTSHEVHQMLKKITQPHLSCEALIKEALKA